MPRSLGGLRKLRVDRDVLILATPVLWGASFPAAKIALRYLPPFPFMALTRTLGLLSILCLIPLMRRTEPSRPLSIRQVVVPGLWLGALIFAGYTLQTEGLARTTATNAGFITGLYVVFVPLIAALAFRQRVPRAAWIAVLISVCGLGLLSIQSFSSTHLHSGDLLVLGGAVAWAGHVTTIGRISARYPAWLLSTAQMAATAAFQWLAVIGSGLHLDTVGTHGVWALLLVTGVVGSGLGYTLQIVAQQSLTSTRAVVILAGEALFSAFFAAIWIGERLSPHQWFGAVLVLGAMVFSELAARRGQRIQIEPASAE